jgi:hypothetical protein
MGKKALPTANSGAVRYHIGFFSHGCTDFSHYQNVDEVSQEVSASPRQSQSPNQLISKSANLLINQSTNLLINQLTNKFLLPITQLILR